MTADGQGFWAWSLKVYGAGRVEELCLDMQESFGANVNMVLACAWAARTLGLALSPEQLRAVLKGLSPWSASVTQPLRAARRALRQAPAPEAALSVLHVSIGEEPEPSAAEATQNQGDSDLRTLVKDAELRAERLEQAYLERALTALAAESETTRMTNESSRPQSEDVAFANLDAYGRLLHISADTAEWAGLSREFVRELFTRLN